MPKRIKIVLEGKVELKGELFDTPAAEAVKECIPFEIEFDRWGKELYGVLNKKTKDFKDKTQVEMDEGDLAYHRESGWFCIFWGPTPSSIDDKPRAAVEVCKIGKVHGDWSKVEELTPPVKGRVDFD